MNSDDESSIALERRWEKLFEIEAVATGTGGIRADALCFKCKCSHGCRWLVADPEVFGYQYLTTRLSHAVLSEGNAVRETLEQLDSIHRLLRDKGDVTEVARSAADVARINSEGKVPTLIGVDGAAALDGSAALLRMYFELGARYLTLSDRDLADAADNALGETVGEANRLGMLVHAAGVAPDGIRTLLDLSSAPIVASDLSGDDAVPLDEDAMQLVTSGDGLVMTDPTSAGDVRQLAETIARVIGIVGVEHVGLATSGAYGDQGIAVYPELRRELADRDFGNDDMEKVLGGNLLRTWQAVEGVAYA